MRAFFCLELEPNVKRAIDAWAQPLRPVNARVSWVKPENFHVTLKFLGEIEVRTMANLRINAEAIAKNIKPFSLSLNTAGAFPNEQKPRVVWVGCSALPEELTHLSQLLEERMSVLEFSPERNFRAHVTLDRVKEENRIGVEELSKRRKNLGKFESHNLFKHLTLMESQLTPQGSLYTPIFNVEFTGS